MISDTRLPRDHKIDMVKTAAIWSVVLCHVAAAPFSGGVVGTTSWYSAVLWTSLAHACVPLFFIIVFYFADIDIFQRSTLYWIDCNYLISSVFEKRNKIAILPIDFCLHPIST